MINMGEVRQVARYRCAAHNHADIEPGGPCGECMDFALELQRPVAPNFEDILTRLTDAEKRLGKLDSRAELQAACLDTAQRERKKLFEGAWHRDRSHWEEVLKNGERFKKVEAEIETLSRRVGHTDIATRVTGLEKKGCEHHEILFESGLVARYRDNQKKTTNFVGRDTEHMLRALSSWVVPMKPNDCHKCGHPPELEISKDASTHQRYFCPKWCGVQGKWRHNNDWAASSWNAENKEKK